MNRKNRNFKSISILLSILIVLSSLLFFPNLNNDTIVSTASGAIITVDDNGTANYTKISYAIENASWGDTIIVRPGNYKERLTIEKSITLLGNGKGNTTIEGGITYKPVVYINANNVTFSGFGVVNSSWIGIEVQYSNHVVIDNNSVKNCYFGIKMNYVDNCTVTNNTLIKNDEAGISIEHTSYNYIGSNNCTRNSYGIKIYKGYKETVELNSLFRNIYTGISLDSSNKITISNNSMVSCGVFFFGRNPSHWDSHTVDSLNTVNSKPIRFWKNKVGGTVPTGAGQVIIASSRNIVVESQNCSYGSSGLIIGFSQKIVVRNNVFSNNRNNVWFGGAIHLYGCNNITIENNILNSNYYTAIYIEDSLWNTIFNNTFNNNNYGIYQSWESNYHNVTNNTITHSNQSGIQLVDSCRNIISKNTIENNTYGINLEWSCMQNTIFENIVKDQLSTGIQITSMCPNNNIFHNNIINNPTQATDDPSNGNNWYKNSEGNYWDDYNGKDNDGDGIGDTSVPHPGTGFDRYPFIVPNGWLYPGEARLKKPGSVDNDGNYTISWNVNNRANGYILEEDVSDNFVSSTELYNGTNASYDFINKSEGTYYYRLKVFNDHHFSNWSTPVNVTVDYLPIIPRNISVHAFPFGNALKIFWEPNVHDTTNYEIYYRTNDTQTWTLLANLSHPNGDFIHMDLIDGERYHYKLRSLDARGQYSDFTKEYYGVPSDTMAPAAPTGLEAEAISDNEIHLTWTANFDDDLAGYFIYMNDTDNKNNLSVIHTINGSDTVYTKSDLTEQVTYYFKIQAFDEVPNNSSFSDIVSATPPDETHPIAPTGLKISNITHDSLTISWAPNPESDIIGYTVYRSTSLKADYKNITDITTTQFSDTNLEENTFYYYKIKAVDDANLISLFSEYVIAQTLIGPKAPEINNSISDFEIVEDTVDELSINLYYIFKDINNDPLTFNCVGQEHINVTIEQTSGAVILKPEENWNGQETLTFYANDGIFETNYNVTIIVTDVNDPPGLARIIAPEDGLTINEDSEIEFRGECTDPDLSYGDELTFSWNSNNDGEIGVGVNLTGIKLSTGKHKITLTVTDKLGLSSETSITVNVNKIEDDKHDGGGSGGFNYIWIVVGIVIGIVVLILILKKRKKVTVEIPTEQVDLEIKPQQEPERQLQEPTTQPEISKEQQIAPVPEQLEPDVNEQLDIPQEQEPIESSSEPEQFPDEPLEE